MTVVCDNTSINDSQVTLESKETIEVQSSREKDGLNVGQTAFFIMGSIAGSGVVALPNAILGTGWIGLVLLAVFCIPATYSGLCLGKCWIMMEERYEDCRIEVRQPYQTIGARTYGKWLSVLITICIQVNLLGVCVVYTLLIAGMFEDLFKEIWNVNICYWDMVVIAIFIPLSWFQTPKDFWVLAVGAAVSIMIASVMLTVLSILDIGEYVNVNYPNPTFKSFTLALGTILFGYAGAIGLPTFQNDMKDRSKFPKATIIGFAGTLIVYFPVAISGYLVYGNYVTSNIAMSIQNKAMKITVQLLIIFHLLCALVLISNPAFQTFEDIFRIKPGFGIIKAAFRTFVVIVLLFIGETVPSFGAILDLLGGSITPLLCFVIPCVCYVKLVKTQPETNVKQRTISYHEWAFITENIVVSILVGIAATVSAIEEIASPNSLSKPCYVN
ncbi:hypothetical protein CHUAL_002854 [Chamberlinius hualienensis]